MLNFSRTIGVFAALILFPCICAENSDEAAQCEGSSCKGDPLSMTDETIYQFTAKNADGEDVSMEKYKGKVVLIVNVASQCGLTDSNYNQLKEMLDKYHSKGLEIAAFPCNQFGGQEPGSLADIKAFVGKYNFAPDLYDKIDVNGDNAHPLYKFLKKQQGGTLIDAIKWNFTKFLVDKSGKPVKRYGPTTAPKDIYPDIENLL